MDAADDAEPRVPYAKPRVVIANERAKLLANALDRASTACVTVGILGPTAAPLDGPGATLQPRNDGFYAASAIMRLLTARLLHGIARLALGTLRGWNFGFSPTSSCRS